MTFTDALEALVLGLVEGLTEFLPVSSTGHLLLLGHFIGFESNGKTFEVLIQLGAILAILSVYCGKLLTIARGLPTDPGMRRFVLGVLLAFLPAAIVGALLHGFIKEVLFDPKIVCISLLVGGVVLLAVDGLKLRVEYRDAMHYPLSMYLKIGICQCLAMIPGVSRSGATIVGSLLMGTDKRSAAEFTFWIAMPIMGGAFIYDLYKAREVITAELGAAVIIGFAMAFVVAFFVVRYLLDYISRHGFSVFAYWRIFVGAIGLWGVLLFK